MKGETVVLRTFDARPKIAKVWDFSGNVVAICSEENYQRLIDGLTDIMPIGFKVYDVFVCTPEIEDQVRQNPNSDLDWKSLKPWCN